MKKSNQKGLAHLAILLLLVVVAVVVFAGYKVAKNHNKQAAVQPATAATASASQAIPVIKNTADLNTVESTLNSQNIDGDLNPDNYNQDVQNLL